MAALYVPTLEMAALSERCQLELGDSEHCRRFERRERATEHTSIRFQPYEGLTGGVCGRGGGRTVEQMSLTYTVRLVASACRCARQRSRMAPPARHHEPFRGDDDDEPPLLP